jgi:flagellar hook-length control protein FliK
VADRAALPGELAADVPVAPAARSPLPGNGIDSALWSPAVLQRNLAEAALSVDGAADAPSGETVSVPTSPVASVSTSDAQTVADASFNDSPGPVGPTAAPERRPAAPVAPVGNRAVGSPAVSVDPPSTADGSALVAAASRLGVAGVPGATVTARAALPSDDPTSSSLSAPTFDTTGPVANPLDALATNARTSVAAGPAAGAAARSGAVPMAAMPERISALVQRGRENGQTTHKMTVRLDPPDLGLVSVHFELKDGAVSVLLRPERTEAGTLLGAQRERVAEVLQREGLNLSSFDVRTDSGGTDRGSSGRHGGGGRNGPSATAPIDLDRPADTQLTLERELRL